MQVGDVMKLLISGTRQNATLVCPGMIHSTHHHFSDGLEYSYCEQPAMGLRSLNSIRLSKFRRVILPQRVHNMIGGCKGASTGRSGEHGVRLRMAVAVLVAAFFTSPRVHSLIWSGRTHSGTL